MLLHFIEKHSIIYMFYTKFITYYVYFNISIYWFRGPLKKICFRDRVLVRWQVPFTKNDKTHI